MKSIVIRVTTNFLLWMVAIMTSIFMVSAPAWGGSHYSKESAITTQHGEILYTYREQQYSNGLLLSASQEWVYGDSIRIEIFGVARSRVLDVSGQLSGGRLVGHVVYFRQRAWAKYNYSMAPISVTQEEASYRQGIKNRSYRIISVQRFGTRKIFKLRASSVAAINSAPSVGPPKPPVLEEDIWVDASSYFPVKEIVYRSNEKSSTFYQLLAPTKSSIRQLYAPIPSGYQMVNR